MQVASAIPHFHCTVGSQHIKNICQRRRNVLLTTNWTSASLSNFVRLSDGMHLLPQCLKHHFHATFQRLP